MCLTWLVGCAVRLSKDLCIPAELHETIRQSSMYSIMASVQPVASKKLPRKLIQTAVSDPSSDWLTEQQALPNTAAFRGQREAILCSGLCKWTRRLS